jgi:hypothetical protein
MNLRGQPLHSGAFKADKPYINCVKDGENIDSFVVAPLRTYQGEYAGAKSSALDPQYTVYTTYIVDNETLQSMIDSGAISSTKFGNPTGLPFNEASVGIEDRVFETSSAANEKARELTEQSQNRYFKDYASGQLKGVSSWSSVDKSGQFNDTEIELTPSRPRFGISFS